MKKSSYIPAKKASLKEIPTSEINEEEKNETMDIISNQDKGEDEDMTLDSELPTTDPPYAADTNNTALIIYINDKIEATEKRFEY